MEVRHVGIIGHSRAGKTTMLTRLSEAFVNRGWTVRERGGDIDHLSVSRRQMLNGLWPSPTDPNTEVPRIDFEISNNLTGIKFVLNFHDPSGELFDQPLPKDHRHYEARSKIIRSLADAHGLLIMVDRNRTKVEIDDLITRNLQDIDSTSEGPARKRRVAILFTKSDMLNWQRKVRIPLADDWVRYGGELNPDLWRKVNETVGQGNVHFFFSSASGWSSGMPNIRTLVQPRPFVARESTEAQPAFPQSGRIEKAGDHIPDPPQRASEGFATEASSNPAGKFMGGLPMFSDPLRIVGPDSTTFFENTIYQVREADEPGHSVKEKLVDHRTDWVGVHELPGRWIDGRPDIPIPWNLVEPLLWAVGYGELP